jgi:hypothetical protein
LLKALVQQTCVALVNARSHAREQAGAEREREIAARERATAEQLRTANLALEQAMTDLARSVAAVQRSLDIHNRFTAVMSVGDRQEGIARTLHELTGLPVAIEDRHGNLTAWAGPGRPDPYPKPTPARREQSLRRAIDARAPVRDRGRLITLAQPGSEVLGVIALIDPHRTAGESEKVALEHANTVLALELAHLQALGEAELRLRRDLVEELLAGTDPQRPRSGPGVGLRPDPPPSSGSHYRWKPAHQPRVVLSRGAPRDARHWSRIPACCQIRRSRGALRGRAGLGAVPGGDSRSAGPGGALPNRCRRTLHRANRIPRSHGEAQLALKMQVATGSPEQVTVFEDLGIYRLLSETTNIGSVEGFIHQWLGALLDYDAAKEAQLVETLSCYLECGGNYDLTAKTLSLHRSTLRYRLQRLRDISGLDLNDPDTRFNLQLATRAWKTMQALRQQR